MTKPNGRSGTAQRVQVVSTAKGTKTKILPRAKNHKRRTKSVSAACYLYQREALKREARNALGGPYSVSHWINIKLLLP